ncbi:OmpH family outer membrane protein [Acidisphaera sp. S103]|uniref:OmpH family outer membrane protein n=1 Tax=Acidisphaera sp. S103 TaxID=1747223 RepID=UPI00131E03BD|nr:OmpH family outer membrane protein [Acidisphaera sp. S103]
MIQNYIKGAGAVVALALVFAPVSGFAQQAQNPEWFVPGPAHPAATPPAHRAAPRPAPSGAPGEIPIPNDGGSEQAGGVPTPQFQLPPAPEIPPIPKGQATPAAIVGILSVPDVLRVSTAYQTAYKELNARGQKLNEDAQKEQAALRDLGQAFAAERAKLSPEQIRTKEKEIQDRATEAQRRFGERNRIIQEAGQYVMMQINRTMEQVAQQVALSRGINLVLNRAQILGTTADFDITPAVAEVLNKTLPSVVVPPDGVSPLTMASAAATQNEPKKAEAKPAAAAKSSQKH